MNGPKAVAAKPRLPAETSIREIRLAARNCECCEGSTLEPLWRYSYNARTRNGRFVFNVSNVICRRCGFVFVSPVYQETDLAAYYEDSYSQAPHLESDFDVRKRCDFIGSLGNIGEVFLEVGANQRGPFREYLIERFSRLVTVELNNSVQRDYCSLAMTPSGSIDVVAHYFVLEHVPRVKSFLAECHRVLRSGGLMVVEVPDIGSYIRDQSALQLYEHTNHFSRNVLVSLLRRAGFELVHLNTEACSRSFGFVAAFRKARPIASAMPAVTEYAANRELFLRGLAALRTREAELLSMGARLSEYSKAGVPVICWGANEQLARFLAVLSCEDSPIRKLPDGTVVIDSDPAKSRFLDGYDVCLPADSVNAMQQAGAIFLFTRLHASSILDYLEREHGRRFSSSDIHIVDLCGT